MRSPAPQNCEKIASDVAEVAAGLNTEQESSHRRCVESPLNNAPHSKGMLATLTDAVPLNKALRDFFPKGRTGNPVALSTGLRWIHKGVVGPSGERVRLNAVRVGGQTYVSMAAAEKFIAALNTGSAASKSDADADLARRAKEAAKALESLGC